LISSSCIARNSNFRYLSKIESSEGSTVPTVSTTSSGREDKVAPTASSGFIFPDTVKALQNFKQRSEFEQKQYVHVPFITKKDYIESIRRDDGTE
jgi:hypothetical protein